MSRSGRPVGDVITADVARESADVVTDRLASLRLAAHGAINMGVVDTVVSKAAYRRRGRPRATPRTPSSGRS